MKLDPEPVSNSAQVYAEPYIWDDEWLVFGDHWNQLGARPEHVAAQFRRRPARVREWRTPRIEEIEREFEAELA